MNEKSTVRSVTFDLLRTLGLTTVFGNTPLIVTSGQQHRELVIGEP